MTSANLTIAHRLLTGTCLAVVAVTGIASWVIFDRRIGVDSTDDLIWGLGVISPHACLALLALLLHRRRAASAILLLFTIANTGFGMYLFYDTFCNVPSSESWLDLRNLVFSYCPLYQWIGLSVFVLGLSAGCRYCPASGLKQPAQS